MKLWIRVDACMARDPKVAEFAAAIGADVPTTVGHLAMVWGAMAEHAVDGWIGKAEGNADETGRKPLPNALIESYAMWHPKRGRPRGTFAQAFRELFVASDGVVNGWAKRQGALIERMEKDRRRKIRGNSSETPRNVHGDSTSTERNGTEQKKDLPASQVPDTPPRTAKPTPAPRKASSLPPATWVGRLTQTWTTLAGSVGHGQVGKQLKPYVETYGESRVESGMRVYIAVKQAEGSPLNFGWFASDAVQWIERASNLGVVDGEWTPELEMVTRPPRMAS